MFYSAVLITTMIDRFRYKITKYLKRILLLINNERVKGCFYFFSSTIYYSQTIKIFKDGILIIRVEAGISMQIQYFLDTI